MSDTAITDTRQAFAEFDPFDAPAPTPPAPPKSKPMRKPHGKFKRSPVRDRSEAFGKVLAVICDERAKPSEYRDRELPYADVVELSNEYNLRTENLISFRREKDREYRDQRKWKPPTSAEKAQADREMFALRQLAPLRKLIAVACEPEKFEPEDLAAEALSSIAIGNPEIVPIMHDIALALDIAQQLRELSAKAKAGLFEIYARLIDAEPEFFQSYVVNYDRGDVKRPVDAIYPPGFGRWLDKEEES